MKKIDDIIYKSDCHKFLEINGCYDRSCIYCPLSKSLFYKMMKELFGVSEKRIDKLFDTTTGHLCTESLKFYKEEQKKKEKLAKIDEILK